MDAAKTVRIVYPANLRCGYCQIPEAEFDPSVHTVWREPGGDHLPAQDDGFPDNVALRAAIKAATGKAPGPRTSREALIEQFNAIPKGEV